MKPWDVVLHIGAPKTGSSAIQRFCRRNRKMLASSGFYYPDHSIDNNGVSGGHSFVSGPLLQDNLELAEKNFNICLQEARRRKLPLLLSAEGFYRKAEALARMTQGLNVRVIGFFRSPVEALVSAHNQMVKRHFLAQRLKTFCQQKVMQENANLSGECLHHWADTFGDAQCFFLPYDSAAYRESSIELDFLQAIGVQAEQRERFHLDRQWVNRSYTPAALELKRLLNSVLTTADEALNRDIDTFLQGYSDRSDEEVARGLTGIDANLVTALQATFADTNRRLMERFTTLRRGLDTSVTPDKKAASVRPARLNLSIPLEALFASHPELEEVIYERVASRLSEARSNPALAKLADLLGFEVDEPVGIDTMLSAKQQQRLFRDGNEPADYLRELALMLEAAQDFYGASRFIDKAHTLRPKGAGIRRIKQRLDDKRAWLSTQ